MFSSIEKFVFAEVNKLRAYMLDEFTKVKADLVKFEAALKTNVPGDIAALKAAFDALEAKAQTEVITAMPALRTKLAAIEAAAQADVAKAKADAIAIIEKIKSQLSVP